MTEYQRIENELLSLGWRKEQGMGDHQKFYKEGVQIPIVVSMSVGRTNRSLMNSYSEIRRAEPRFSLGRQQHMLENDSKEEEDTMPEGLPAWLGRSQMVRYTAPENRDWSKLKDKDSVMNRPYLVKGYKETDDGMMVHVCDAGGDGSSYHFPDELDSWETAKCDECGTEMPVSRLGYPEDWQVRKGHGLCEDCIRKFNEKKEKTLKVLEETATEAADKIMGMVENLPFEDAALKRFLTLWKMESNEEDAENRKIIHAAMAETYKELISKSKKFLKKKWPKIIEPFETKEVKEVKTPYEAWKHSLETIYYYIRIMQYKPGSAYLAQLKHDLYSSTYTTKVVKEPGNKKKNAAVLIKITTKEWSMTKQLWMDSMILFHNFKAAYADLPVFILLENNPASFRQYMTDPLAEDYKEMLGRLKELFPEANPHEFRIAESLLLLPEIKGISNQVNDILDKNGLDGAAKSTEYIMIPKKTAVCDDEGDEEEDANFEYGNPAYSIRISMEENSTDDALDKTMASLRELAKTNPAPIFVEVFDEKTNRREKVNFMEGYQYPEPTDAPAAVPEENEPVSENEGTLLLKFVWEDNGRDKQGDLVVSGIDELEKDPVRRDHLIAALCCTAFENDVLGDIYRQALERVMEKAETNPEIARKWKSMIENITKKDNNMKEENILDMTNPGSANRELGAQTTKELLRELKSRGVEFDNLTVTVRKTIDFNAI